MRRQLPTLKAFYYLDHFEEMITFIRDHCSELIGEDEEAFLTRFQSLRKPAKGLLVRLSNRKAQIFSRKSLNYAELGRLDPIITELLEKQLIDLPGPDDFNALTSSLTKPDLLELLEHSQMDLRGLRSLGKSRLVDAARERCDFSLLEQHGYTSQFVLLRRIEALEYLRFIFFGRPSDSLQAFALRDLGITQSRSKQTGIKAPFSNESEARAAFFFSRIRQQIKTCNLGDLVSLVDDAPNWPADGRDDTLARLGSELEKNNCHEIALKAYSMSDNHPARERRCRIMYSQGERHGVRLLLKEIISSPHTDEELLFAEDFYARKYSKKAVGVLTSTLRNARVVKINEAYRGNSEQGVIDHLKKNGYDAYHSENHFWASLFGCYFWDELYQSSVNEFDSRPSGLFNGMFATEHSEAITSKLEMLQPRYISDCFRNHFGEANGLFPWKSEFEPLLLKFLELCPEHSIIQALKRIVDAPHQNLSGYPDLLLMKGNQISFVEVKAEGDQLRRNQLAQIIGLKECGFKVDIARVQWKAQEDQEYVVVDVETTGGSPVYHRVTEIGAVRMIGTEIVDRFQTLVNPQRRIPRKIQALTGITDAMVSDAPAFEAVSEDLRNFIGDSIFVAHNAKFDFGFIRREFERIGQNFRRPLICTVVESRKIFPKLRSYSLANLCRDLAIPLKNHHRALQDADATAELYSILLKAKSRNRG